MLRYLAELADGNWREEKGVDGLCFDSAVLIDTVCDQAAWLRLPISEPLFMRSRSPSFIIDIAAWRYTPKIPGTLGIGLKGKSKRSWFGGILRGWLLAASAVPWEGGTSPPRRVKIQTSCSRQCWRVFWTLRLGGYGN